MKEEFLVLYQEVLTWSPLTTLARNAFNPVSSFLHPFQPPFPGISSASFSMGIAAEVLVPFFRKEREKNPLDCILEFLLLQEQPGNEVI